MGMIVLVSIGCVLVCVALHFTAFRRLAAFLEASRLSPRFRVGVATLGAIAAHVVEVLFFAGAFAVLAGFPELGGLRGALEDRLADYSYFSFVTYTTVGYGDVTPYGPLRILAAVEALTGLILVAWTASFLFVQMNRYWSASRPD